MLDEPQPRRLNMLVLDRSRFIPDRRAALAKNLANGLGDFTRGVRESDDERLGPDQWKVYALVVQLRLAVEASQPETARRVAEDARRAPRRAATPRDVRALPTEKQRHYPLGRRRGTSGFSSS